MDEQEDSEPIWRFAGYDAAPGVWQMAVDRYFYRTIHVHPQPVVLRFYRFEPPAITIGYHQVADAMINRQACVKAGIDVARRPTGGRALLHRNEINYAVVADTARAGIFAGGLSEAFQKISSGIAGGLEKLGLVVEVSGGSLVRGGRSSSSVAGLCAASTTRFEVTCQGRKIAASAQLRSGAKLLQHGMIYIDEPEPTPEGLFMTTGRGKRESVMTDLRRALGFLPDVSVVVHALREGFVDVLGSGCLDRVLDQEERRAIADSLPDADSQRGAR